MAALRSISFKESLCEALRDLNLKNVSLRVEQKEAISNTVVLNKHTDHRLCATSAIFTSGSRFYCLQANQC